MIPVWLSICVGTSIDMVELTDVRVESDWQDWILLRLLNECRFWFVVDELLYDGLRSSNNGWFVDIVWMKFDWLFDISGYWIVVYCFTWFDWMALVVIAFGWLLLFFSLWINLSSSVFRWIGRGGNWEVYFSMLSLIFVADLVVTYLEVNCIDVWIEGSVFFIVF